MTRLLALFLAVLLALAGLGCGSDKDRGINSNKDMPRTGDKAE
jgi:hypothetical protein